MPLTFGSLFAGIGGMDLGLERAGMRCVWQVEIDPYARRVLEQHWPHVRRHDDVRTFPPAGEWGCDLICGGFPCQDISRAGRMEGIDDGKSSSLWTQFARVLRVVRPRFALVENVARLLVGGIGTVLGDLAACGYDAEWDCVPAASVGARHFRDRVYVLAYRRPGDLDDPGGGRRRAPEETYFAGRPFAELPGGWPAEPGVGRVAHGLPRPLDRRRRRRVAALGNAVVPQVAEWIGRRIVEAEVT
jgi:DNA (cytosine-5)-methyltransferase 1